MCCDFRITFIYCLCARTHTCMHHSTAHMEVRGHLPMYLSVGLNSGVSVCRIIPLVQGRSSVYHTCRPQPASPYLTQSILCLCFSYGLLIPPPVSPRGAAGGGRVHEVVWKSLMGKKSQHGPSCPTAWAGEQVSKQNSVM